HHRAGGQHGRLAVREAVLVRLVVAGGEEQVLGVGRPGQLAALRVALGDALELTAALVADPDLLAAVLVTDEGDPLAVGRPARLRLARPRRARQPADVAAVGGDG